MILRAGDEIRTRDVQLGKTPVLWRFDDTDILTAKMFTSHRRDSDIERLLTGFYRFSL